MTQDEQPQSSISFKVNEIIYPWECSYSESSYSGSGWSSWSPSDISSSISEEYENSK